MGDGHGDENAARYAAMFNGIILNRCKDAMEAGVDPGTVVGTLLSHAAALHCTVSRSPEDFLIGATAALKAAEQAGDGGAVRRIILPSDSGAVN